MVGYVILAVVIIIGLFLRTILRFFFGDVGSQGNGEDRSVFGFFVEFFEELYRGHRYARTFAKLSAFGAVIATIIAVVILLSIMA